MKPATLNNRIFQVSREREKRIALEENQVRNNQTVIADAISQTKTILPVPAGQLQTVKRAGLIFDPARTYGTALAQLLGAPSEGLPINSDDLAEALRLTALKIESGDINFLRMTLLGQAAVVEALMMEAAREYKDSETRGKWQWARVRLREFQQLQKAHMRTIATIAGLSNKN